MCDAQGNEQTGAQANEDARADARRFTPDLSFQADNAAAEDGNADHGPEISKKNAHESDPFLFRWPFLTTASRSHNL
jgi:hypothetical protein